MELDALRLNFVARIISGELLADSDLITLRRNEETDTKQKDNTRLKIAATTVYFFNM